MKNKIIAMFFIPFVFLLTACTKQPAPPTEPANVADASLAESSFAVSRAISSLSETAQAARPTVHISTPPNPRSYGMGTLTSIDWSGPVEPLVREIARATDYRLHVLGQSPAIPVMVSVFDKNRMIGEILRDVAYQCGRRANIIIFPESRLIELRYAKN